MRNLKNLIIITGLFFLISPLFALQDYQEREAEHIYMEAKKKSVQKQWSEAIDLFQSLIDQFPVSRFVDDALFWTGYCQEKIPEKQKSAFDTFSSLTKKYPKSPWADDAMAHQVKLAEFFFQGGDKKFHKFLLQKLDSPIADVKYRAALALGRAGDRKALPILKELKNDEILGQLASDIIATLETDLGLEPKFNADSSVIRIRMGKNSVKKERAKKNKFLLGSSRWYDHYVSLLRKNDSWSLPELFAFGLWHILNTNDFDKYFTLKTEYEKYQWYEGLWETVDPTPGTAVNEAREEFERRVVYARANFGEPDTKRYHSRYLRDQWLIPKGFRAPWDSRGEIYIKYGEPSFVSFMGLFCYDWQYYNYDVDFVLQQHMTNIHGNAIFPGDMFRSKYGRDVYYFYDYFVNNREFFYNQNNPVKLVKTVSFHWEIPASQEKRIRMFIEFPGKTFQTVRLNNQDEIVLRLIYSVFDSTMEKVAEDRLVKELENRPNGNRLLRSDWEIPLHPGKYKINVEVQDLASHKAAYLNEEFSIPAGE